MLKIVAQPCSEDFSGTIPARVRQGHISPEHSPQKEVYIVRVEHLMIGVSMNTRFADMN